MQGLLPLILVRHPCLTARNKSLSFSSGRKTFRNPLEVNPLILSTKKPEKQQKEGQP
jgi:hypothetical protein